MTDHVEDEDIKAPEETPTIEDDDGLIDGVDDDGPEEGGEG